MRSSRGLSAMKKRAVFADWALPLPPMLPVCEANPAMSGSPQQHRAQFALQAHHFHGRDFLRRFGEAVEHADVLDREEAFWNLDHHHDR